MGDKTMEKLTTLEVEIFADTLGFTFDDAAAIIDIFYREKRAGNWRFERYTFDHVTEYIAAWEDSWSRYSTWNSMVQSEKDQGPDGYTEATLHSFINKGVFLLPSGLYILGCL